MSDDWYRRYQTEAIHGMATLTLEERGVLITIIDHQFLMGRPLPDEPSYMAGILGCDVRVWKRLRRQLIDKQKIDASGGHIAELGATYELAKRQAERSQKVAAGHKGGIASGASRRNNGLGEAKTESASTRLEERRGEEIIKKENSPPKPPSRGACESFGNLKRKESAKPNHHAEPQEGPSEEDRKLGLEKLDKLKAIIKQTAETLTQKRPKRFDGHRQRP